MQYKILKEKWHIDHPEGFRCRFITSDTETEVLHKHEYFEIFLTLSDNIVHKINGEIHVLPKGSLVFIRPTDIHLYTHETESYQFINLAFSTSMANSLFEFLGDSFPIKRFLSAPMPPSVVLSQHNVEKLTKSFSSLNYLNINDANKKILQCKMILFTVFLKYFTDCLNPSETSIPVWLEELVRKMKNREHFVLGIEHMTELSGKTYGHLSRMLKQYYQTTPTELINDFRLTYAANMLKYSNHAITDICFECGYNNPSYFFTRFKKKYHVSPTEFRNTSINVK